MTHFHWICFVLIIHNNVETIQGDCRVNTNKLIDKSPLILNEDKQFIYPTHNSILQFRQAENYTFVCPGKMLQENSFENPTLRDWFTYGSCIENQLMHVVGQNEPCNIANMSCEVTPQHTVKELSPSEIMPTCSMNGYTYLATGFHIPDNHFLQIVEICYDEHKSRPILAFNEIHPAVKFRQRYPLKRLKFSKKKTHKDLGDAYIRHSQKMVFENQFGDRQEYIKYDGEEFSLDNQYLERGQLAPREDFYYNSQQEATLYYVNAVPLWRTINAGNWKKLEEHIRRLSINTRTTLQVWTGAKKILKFHINNTLQEVYIQSQHENASETFHVKVPKLLLKLVYEPITQRAVVFVAINNPFWTRSPSDIVCTDVIKSINWTPDFHYDNNYLHGFVYACSYKDVLFNFHAFLPTLRVVGLLDKIPIITSTFYYT